MWTRQIDLPELTRFKISSALPASSPHAISLECVDQAGQRTDARGSQWKEIAGSRALHVESRGTSRCRCCPRPFLGLTSGWESGTDNARRGFVRLVAWCKSRATSNMRGDASQRMHDAVEHMGSPRASKSRVESTRGILRVQLLMQLNTVAQLQCRSFRSTGLRRRFVVWSGQLVVQRSVWSSDCPPKSVVHV